MRVEDTEDGDTVLVSGRGLLHLTVLIETMRREGFELMVGPPTVIEKNIDGERMEPFELVRSRNPPHLKMAFAYFSGRLPRRAVPSRFFVCGFRPIAVFARWR
jgi:hypothetical protein